MKITSYIFMLSIIFSAFACKQKSVEVKSIIDSPSKDISVEFYISSEGEPKYLIKYKGELVIDTSFISFDFKDHPPLARKLKVIATEEQSINEDWELPWGEQRMVKSNSNQMLIKLQEEKDQKRKFNIYFRAFDDGVGFRYEFLEQEDVDSLIIMQKKTRKWRSN